MNKKEKMYQEIKKHGDNLKVIFNLGAKVDSIKLCKKLRKLEVQARQLTIDYCNGENGINTDNWEEKAAPIMNKVYKVLNNGKYNDDRPHQKRIPVFLNGDARGYALKINSDYTIFLREAGRNIYTDMGGFGIIAPDFSI